MQLKASSMLSVVVSPLVGLALTLSGIHARSCQSPTMFKNLFSASVGRFRAYVDRFLSELNTVQSFHWSAIHSTIRAIVPTKG